MFVLEPDYPDYGQERIVQAYQNYTPRTGDNNFISMNIYDDEQPIIVNQSKIVKNLNGTLENHTKIRTDWSLIIEFYGDKGCAISSSFRNKMNDSKVTVGWFLRNFGIVPLTKARRINNNDVLDQKSYTGKYDVLFKVQSVELVITPVPKITKIEIHDYQII